MQVQAWNQAISASANSVAEGAISRPAHGSFAAMLAGRTAMTDRESEARAAAQQLVASTLLMPILKQARQDPMRSDLFHGGFTEDAFGAQLDTELADRIAQSSRFDLVEQIARRLIRTYDSTPRSSSDPSLTPGDAAEAGRKVDLHG